MAIGKLWAGRTYGTHIGNLFLKMDGSDENLSGRLHFSSGDSNVIMFNISAVFDGNALKIEGEQERRDDLVDVNKIYTVLYCTSNGVLRGEWETSNGAAGTLELHPHDVQQQVRASTGVAPPQLFSARFDFRAVSLDKGDIIAIAESVQREFSTGLVTVLFTGKTEKTLFLDDFRRNDFHNERINIVRIFARETQSDGLDRSVTIEFGPHVNFLSTQGGDEAWVLGVREKLKFEVARFERYYATNFKKLNIGFLQFLFIAAVVYLPSLSDLKDRAILMVGVILIAAGVTRFHDKFLPHADLHITDRPQGIISRIGPTIVSWVVSVTASVAATILALYLQSLSQFH